MVGRLVWALGLVGAAFSRSLDWNTCSVMGHLRLWRWGLDSSRGQILFFQSDC